MTRCILGMNPVPKLGADYSGNGVAWSPKRGAICPNCGQEKVPINTTRLWDGAYRIRYHRCPKCGLRFKSIETDYTSLD